MDPFENEGAGIHNALKSLSIALARIAHFSDAVVLLIHKGLCAYACRLSRVTFRRGKSINVRQFVEQSHFLFGAGS